MNKKKKGLVERYKVRRLDGSTRKGKKHDKCEFFVLDLTHDKFAEVAIERYANACYLQYRKLAEDLRAGIKRRALARLRSTPGVGTGPLKVGDYVRFRPSANGSHGIVESVGACGGGGFYVRWYYGKDVNGEDMCAHSGIDRENLVRVPEAEFNAVRNRKGFGS